MIKLMHADETTDGRYVKVGEGEWWDTTGIDLVPQAVVDAYLRDNPSVKVFTKYYPDPNDPPSQETTDGRYMLLGEGQWWDTLGERVVSEEVVESYMEKESVGVVLLEYPDKEALEELRSDPSVH